MNITLYSLAFVTACTVLTGCSHSATQESLAGRYYQGDGLGYNLHLRLKGDGTFACEWTGCGGHYGQTSGTWVRNIDSVDLTANAASGEFVREPIADMVVARTDGTERLVFVTDLDLLNDTEMLPYFSFAPYPRSDNGR